MEIAGLVTSITGLCCSLHEIVRSKWKHLGTSEVNIQQLNDLMEDLDARKKDVENRVNELWHLKGAVPASRFNLWLKRVDQVKTEVSSLINENSPHIPTKGCCFICSRIKLGKLIDEKLRVIRGLLETLAYPYLEDSIAIPVINKRGDVLSATPMMECDTHEQICMKIREFLHDENAKRIGVWGMGGVGKTTIMSDINNHLVKGSSPFNCIIWVEASNDIEKVQQDIAVKLGLTFRKPDDERARASKLLEAFNRRKPFALILDDVWEPFSIEKVGIPVPTVENGCKLVIITRSIMVCRGMEIDKDVKVEVLSEDEAWNLFKDKAGEDVLLDPNVQSIAKDVAKECGGLPLAIVAVGRALRNTTNMREWENALKRLRTSKECGGLSLDKIDEAVYSCLKLSYSKLKDDTRRSCFLFCALYPKGHLIDENELINYWVWGDLLGGESTRVIGEMIIHELTHACLLESKNENGVRWVKLHDLIRDMAIRVMSTECRCIVNAGMGEVKPPPPGKWKEDVQWVSLMGNYMKSIGFSPSCPKLTFLLLQYNAFEEKILDDFFDNMQGLKVLDLSYTGISALPVSLSNLKNLRALILSHCWGLVEVPSLARLTELKYLDFSFSGCLTRFPEGMDQLTNLRHLDFSFTSLQNLEAGVISKFTLLEDLLILGSLMIVVSSKDIGRLFYPVRVEEIVSCHKLSLVHMQLHGIVAYQKVVKCLNFSQLKEFKLIVGFRFRATELFEKTSLAIDMLKAEKLSEAEITELIPRNAMELVIHNYSHTIKRLSLHLLGAMRLKTCKIRSCLEMECILESEENNLSQLERMNLFNLPELRMICGKVVKPGTLMNLKSIHVERCSSLKCLFPRRLMLELKNLEEITIVHCHALEEIIEGERNTNDEEIMEEIIVDCHAAKVILPKLQRLELCRLLDLKSIYKGDVQCDSLRTIEVFHCNALNKLPLGLFGIEAGQQMSPPTTLQQIKCDEQWWESLQWDQPQAKQLLQPYLDQDCSRDMPDRFAPSSSNTTKG